jgi:thioredoxin reductase (NADPH)
MDIIELEGEQGKFKAVVARDRDSGETHRFPAAAAFVFIGLKPNNGFLSKDVQRDAGGFLVTSPALETSLSGVFAAGDVRSGSTKQLGSAVGDGITALLMTRRHLEAHHHKAVALVEPLTSSAEG